MTKKQNRNIIVGVLIIVVVLFLFNGFNRPFSIVPSDLDQYVGNCVGGSTILSTSNVNIDAEGDRIRVSALAKGSECMKIQLTQSGLDSVLKSQGYDATRDVIGNIRLLEYTKTFPIDRIGGYAGNLNNQVASGTSLSSATISTCTNKGINAIYAYRAFPFSDVRCVTKGQQGIAGDFSASRSFGNFKVLFELGGQSVTLTREQQSVSIGNNVIKWSGNLVNLDQVFPPQYDAKLIGSKWTLVRDGTLQDVNNAVTDFKRCMDRFSGHISDSQFDSCRSSFNSRTSFLLQDRLSEYKSRTSTLVHDVSTDSNALYVSLKATPFPLFTLDLDASSVGIVILKGKPKITQCISNQELESGKNKNVQFTVLNDANADNVEFSASIRCSEGVLGFIPNFNIGANQQKSITSELIPSNPNQNLLSTNCRLEVRDISSGNTDSCSFTSKVEYQSGILCTPNVLSCDGKKLIKCTSDGKNQEVIKTCEFGCEIEKDGAICSEEDGNGGCTPLTIIPSIFGSDPVTIPNFICEIKNFFSDLFAGLLSFFTILKVISTGIAFIFATLFGKDLFSSFKALRNKPKTAWFLSILVASGIAFIFFKSFWIGVIAFVIWIIFRLLVGGKLLALKRGVRALRR